MDKNQRLCYKLTIATNVIGARRNSDKKIATYFFKNNKINEVDFFAS